MKCLKRRLFLVGTITTLLVTLVSMSWASSNMNSSRSNVNRVGGNLPKGRPVTATTDLSGPSDTQEVYTVPLLDPKGKPQEFYVTQVCVSAAQGGVRLNMVGIGSIALVGVDSANLCQSFEPDGVFVSPGTVITCSINTGTTGSHFCRISGVLP